MERLCLLICIVATCMCFTTELVWAIEDNSTCEADHYRDDPDDPCAPCVLQFCTRAQVRRECVQYCSQTTKPAAKAQPNMAAILGMFGTNNLNVGIPAISLLLSTEQSTMITVMSVLTSIFYVVVVCLLIATCRKMGKLAQTVKDKPSPTSSTVSQHYYTKGETSSVVT